MNPCLLHCEYAEDTWTRAWGEGGGREGEGGREGGRGEGGRELAVVLQPIAMYIVACMAQATLAQQVYRHNINI